MPSVVNNLNLIVQTYLEDTAYHTQWEEITHKRTESISFFRTILSQFLDGGVPLDGFSKMLDAPLRNTDAWGKSRQTVIQEINKLATNHVKRDNSTEAIFRFILRGLNTNTIGSKIEEFYGWIERVRQEYFAARQMSSLGVYPGNSAFIISLFAVWLTSEEATNLYIYYPTFRLGLAKLLDARIIPVPPEVPMNAKGVQITSEKTYRLVSNILDDLALAQRALVTHAFWAESFLHWITQHPALLKNASPFEESVEEFSPEILEFPETPPATEEALSSNSTSVALSDAVNSVPLSSNQLEAPADGHKSSPLLSDTNISYNILTEEGSSDPDLEDPQGRFLDDKGLKSVPEERLKNLIAEVQRHILIDAKLLHRIYRDLLSKNVVLTGPPGTGKTQLARLIPEILWRGNRDQGESEPSGYATELVTAHEEWSVRTLISDVEPVFKEGQVAYRVRDGHLTRIIRRNWLSGSNKKGQKSHQRVSVYTSSQLDADQMQEFRGLWMVIDELNRAHIDKALGEAFTTFSEGVGGRLTVKTNTGHEQLPLPQDFRIIGTLNNFDRNHVYPVSEGLKRRFRFIEIPPPSRQQRAAEQAIVLYKALVKALKLDLSSEVVFNAAANSHIPTYTWQNVVTVRAGNNVPYEIEWHEPVHPFRRIFELAWHLFEVIRIYRQLGTAQAIDLVQQLLIAGLLQNLTTREQWYEALDDTLCDTIADQLQVLLPDELNILYHYLKRRSDEEFINYYNDQLARTALDDYGPSKLEVLRGAVGNDGQEILGYSDIERITKMLADGADAKIDKNMLKILFHLEQDALPLPFPLFARRLHAFKSRRAI